jgi:membrane-bound lytic murein transglycosylase D
VLTVIVMRSMSWCLLPILAACAAAPDKRVVPADEQATNVIYAEIDIASKRFDGAVSHYEAGDLEAATREFAGARGDLRALGERCIALAGCEVGRVIAAQDALLERQARFLSGATEDAEPVNGEAETTGEGDSPLVQALPQAARTVSLLNGKDLAKVIQLNEPVKAAMEEWLTWMRPQFLDAWENYQYMRYRMFPEYEKTGLPEALLFGILAKESGGKVHAVSRAGAAGPLQFMPATGARFGLNRGGPFDLRFDPGESTRANAAYLNERFAELNNNLALALAAYNGGEGRLARLSNKGARDFWSPQVFNALPPETREYVPMVLAAAWLFLHPTDYNLSLPQYDTRAARVTLKSPISLNEIAVCLGQQGNPRGWFRHIRNLNPRWEPTTRLAAGTMLDLPLAASAHFARDCETGPKLAMSRELHEARPPVAPPAAIARRGTSPGVYVVKRGDSLHSIASARRCQVATLAAENGIKKPKYMIRVGQKLRLSGCGRG